MEKIADIIETKGGMVSTVELSGRAEYMRVRRAVKRGELLHVKHGIYAEPSAIVTTMIDVERIVPGGVVCLYNAWAFYQLSTKVPPAFCIAIERKRKVCLPDIVPVNLYYWTDKLLKFGIVEQVFSGNRVKMTDLERSVCDAVKYRNKIGLDVCAEVIRTYLRRKDRNLTRLLDYARRLRVANVLNNYLDVALV